MLSGSESWDMAWRAFVVEYWNELLRLVGAVAVAAEAGVTVIATAVLMEAIGGGRGAGTDAFGVDPAAEADGALATSWSCVPEGRFMVVVVCSGEVEGSYSIRERLRMVTDKTRAPPGESVTQEEQGR